MKGRADIANFALRAFLTKVGHRYDELRGLEPFRPTKSQWLEVLQHFDCCCTYCGAGLASEEITKDHLIPLNKTSLGLHAWGNVVPSCAACNKAKHHGAWEPFLRVICEKDGQFASRCAIVTRFQSKYRYEPTILLADIANNLYEDVGAVAMTLVDLRFKQAERVLQVLTGES